MILYFIFLKYIEENNSFIIYINFFKNSLVIFKLKKRIIFFSIRNIFLRVNYSFLYKNKIIYSFILLKNGYSFQIYI